MNRNLVMWSWCGELSWMSTAEVDTYLFHMQELETLFPNVHFIYITGHLDGSGVAGTLNQNNNHIRQYCRDHNKVLFDFNDMECYDPDGNYYLDRGATDNCDYNGGNWAQQWCAAHPGDPLCESCDCAHSQSLNCNRKARAFWYMLARLNGWNPNPIPAGVTTQLNGNNLVMRWQPVSGAVSYKVFSSTDSETGFAEDLSGTFNGTSWTVPMTNEKKFFYVTAITN
jgi:hypothetical protein